MMDRFCKVCSKKLTRVQTKFCCREHWLLFEKKSLNTCSASRSKNTRKPMRDVIE